MDLKIRFAINGFPGVGWCWLSSMEDWRWQCSGADARKPIATGTLPGGRDAKVALRLADGFRAVSALLALARVSSRPCALF